MKPESTNRILVVDDHPIMRMGLRHLIEATPDCELCGEAGTAHEALEFLGSTNQVDLVIVDLSLPDRSGLELIKEIRSENPDLKCLAISSHDEEVYAERVLHAGGRGYVMKDRAPEQLVEAVTRVLGGGIFLSSNMTARMMEMFAGGNSGTALSSLTDRELEIFKAIGEGRTSREIAGMLDISIRTVDAHRTHIKDKLGYRDATELTYKAISWVQSQA